MTLLDPRGEPASRAGAATRVRPRRPQGADGAPAARTAGPPTPPTPGGGAGRATLLERAVRATLGGLERGSLALVTERGTSTYGPGREASDGGTPDAVATVHDARFWKALALRGSVGAGEAYARGWWSSPEPVDVVRVFVANHDALEAMESGLARVSRPLLKAYHALRDNSRDRARDNISAHYDLSNEFFALFLDPTMTYSSALWQRPEMTLEAAQYAKIDRLCERIGLGPTDHLLEVGTGWGAFAMRAAERFGCRVTTTTISKQQHEFASERIARAGLSDRVEVLLEDYRDLTGTYSKAVSVEMIEAVGARHYPEYFASVARRLERGAPFGVQAITIHDRHFERARRAVDFIQRHIFPGSCIPSVESLTRAATRASDMRLVAMEDFGGHYARTLRIWRDALRARWDEARALGFDDDFLRLFDFYFAYCEGGFEERHISVAHLVFAREGRGFASPIARGRLAGDAPRG